MSRKNHEWGPSKPPPQILTHSLAKHRVLKAYLEQYVSVLTANIRQERLRLTLVDGFAGGGVYLDSAQQEQSGSPLIMLDAMARSAKKAQECRAKPFLLDVQYIFIEKDKGAFDYLLAVLKSSPYAHMIGSQIHLLNEEFTTQVPSIIDFVKKRGPAGRVIFSLDQFGYTDVPLSIIYKILSELKKAEILLTFATDFLIDYLSENDQTQQTLQKVGISLPSSSIGTAKESPQWRQAIQFALHNQIPDKTKAEYYTPFFIRSADSHRDFWIIHLSKHYRARDVMVGLHWQEGNSFAHYGGSGLDMFGYSQVNDFNLTRQQQLPGFHFDETALQLSREALLTQLPEKISSFATGVSFEELFAKVTNGTPATADIIKKVLAELARDRAIQILDPVDGKARHSGVQKHSDVLILPRQKRLFT